MLSLGLIAIAVCFSVLDKIKNYERINVNLERCEKCFHCKMSDYTSKMVYCDKVGNGEFIEPLENCIYCTTSKEKSLVEIFKGFDNEV